MIETYLRLPNGNIKKFYTISALSQCIIKFTNTTINEAKEFLGSGTIDYIDILDANKNLVRTITLNMKRKSVSTETATISIPEKRIVQNAFIEKRESIDPDTGGSTIIEIPHETIYETINVYTKSELITATLVPPSIEDDITDIKNSIGIVNTNNMTLDEFKAYYKEQIGKQCTAAIENGVDIETSLGKKHFSYTIEDQSNIKDLVITASITDFTLPLPYHADGEPCAIYQPKDIMNIYMELSSNKTYHTTYCNILNLMIAEATDMISVKEITYGMELNDKRYIEILAKITSCRDGLLSLVADKFDITDKEIGKDENIDESFTENSTEESKDTTEETNKDTVENTEKKDETIPSEKIDVTTGNTSENTDTNTSESTDTTKETTK